MFSHPGTLLVLVLCLSWTIRGQEEKLPPPFISAEPDHVVSQGKSVTILCQAPAGFEIFRLEKGGVKIKDEKNSLSSVTVARFPVDSASEDTAGQYHCIYQKESIWSLRSEILELTVTSEDVMLDPAPVSALPSDVMGHCLRQRARSVFWIDAEDTSGFFRTSPTKPRPSADSPGLMNQHLYILIGISVVILLCLLLLLFCLHRQHQMKQGTPSGNGQEKRPQERLSQTVGHLEKTPDMSTAERLPEMDTEKEDLIPAAGSPQEVTYAQLDPLALRAQRAEKLVPSHYTEPLTESATYATIARP
ncbi:leukocyte-associated immunoglobulin-like receptor 1 isoform X2 [Castor canadensis]|uniref:Leukocyte-associated immunoglobulin-like receptor 1 isoform X2 n=1 Tax=Castor canadensis TaxID=51338 RepID=A0AC58LB01_CASCN